MQSIRIYEMPPCKMVSSGIGMFGDERFDAFDKWFSKQKRGLYPKDFLFWDKYGFHWIYMYEEGLEVPEELGIIEFVGGLYAAATGVDEQTDMMELKAEVKKFLEENGLEPDDARSELASVVSTPEVEKILGFSQMDYFIPIKVKEKKENAETEASEETEEEIEEIEVSMEELEKMMAEEE